MLIDIESKNEDLNKCYKAQRILKNRKPKKPLIVKNKNDMITPFTADEIEKVARSLKNNKSTGIDNIKTELIKYAPNNVHKLIADIYNETARSGDYPEEQVAGILTQYKNQVK